MNRISLPSVLLALCLATIPAAAAEESPTPVPSSVTFVTSSGYWEETAHPDNGADAAGAKSKAESQEDAASATKSPTRRGYYKLIAVRQKDGTARIHLQQIEATADGPKILTSTELDEFTALKPYVTDIRPESSTGISSQPGLFATIYLKTDPKAVEPESWTVLIDDLGDIKIEKATN
ncbi:hypothetical protein [Sinorhizobium sp. BG8]|uniref:hypothetical protein n=1 Tax=Sinorhizobium sp. BG8 TaxID=2613773 RepID=UPI00193EB54D|nr:hypothetical protein [Sinorhizobium sp. BG8]QRM55066.1 hypothetical protein F3Y30_11325 [Sinorhizobium sp. BG8]